MASMNRKSWTLTIGIAQGQVHEPVVPPGAVARRGAPADLREQRPADLPVRRSRGSSAGSAVIRLSVVEAIETSSRGRSGFAMPPILFYGEPVVIGRFSASIRLSEGRE